MSEIDLSKFSEDEKYIFLPGEPRLWNNQYRYVQGNASDNVIFFMDFGRDVGVDAGAGNDYVGFTGTVGGTVLGGDGNDYLDIQHTSGLFLVDGGAGNDTLRGSRTAGTLIGGDGDDSLISGDGRELIEGGEGADTLVNAAGDNGGLLRGGAGGDLYVLTAHSGAKIEEVDTDPGIDTVTSTWDYTLAANIEDLIVSARLGTGNSLDNRISAAGGYPPIGHGLFGLDGDDTLVGGVLSDTLVGGNGADRLEGGKGGDLYRVDERDVIVEADKASGIDTVEAAFDYTLGAALEILSFTGAVGRSGAGNASANTLIGASGDDTLAGLDGADRLMGGDGADLLKGGAGSDTLMGGTGPDTLDGGDGGDLYRVGAAVLVLEAAGSSGVDIVEAVSDYTLAANVERLVLFGRAVRGTGNDLANVIKGNEGANALAGGGGNDALFGAGGDDTLSGGKGSDRLSGGWGSDILDGGAGADRLSGGTGRDVFVFNAASGKDVIADFDDGFDRIRLDGPNLSFDKLKIVDLGKDVRITFGSVSIVLQGFDDASKLNAADFLF